MSVTENVKKIRKESAKCFRMLRHGEKVAVHFPLFGHSEYWKVVCSTSTTIMIENAKGMCFEFQYRKALCELGYGIHGELSEPIYEIRFNSGIIKN